jgi:hypothetical protein
MCFLHYINPQQVEAVTAVHNAAVDQHYGFRGGEVELIFLIVTKRDVLGKHGVRLHRLDFNVRELLVSTAKQPGIDHVPVQVLVGVVLIVGKCGLGFLGDGGMVLSE